MELFFGYHIISLSRTPIFVDVLNGMGLFILLFPQDSSNGSVGGVYGNMNWKSPIKAMQDKGSRYLIFETYKGRFTIISPYIFYIF